jgi:flagellar P-ring protein precursor FlgI
MVSDAARAERIKEVATIAGVRTNQLAGYGVIVGLDGTGDQTTQAPFTAQSVINMLSRMGVALPPGQSLQLKNVAAVMVTADLPPFARAGQPIDVTISSIGNAKSLRGGTLLMTPLKGADGQIYAMAQGNVVVGGAGASAGGASATINHLSVGRIAGGATVEREVPMNLAQGSSIAFELRRTDFGTAQRMVEAINKAMGAGTANAVDGRQVSVRLPANPEERVGFLGAVENLTVVPMQQPAKVIVNARTGSVVMNQAVRIDECAIAHGSLSVSISKDNSVSQPPALSGGQTAGVSNTSIDIQQAGGALMPVKASANLADVVRALNALGANPQDLIAILQAMKMSGSLRAELEII